MSKRLRRKYARKTFGKVVHGHYPIPPGFDIFKKAIAVISKADSWAIMSTMSKGYTTVDIICERLAADRSLVLHWLKRMQKSGMVVRIEGRSPRTGKRWIRYYQTEVFADIVRFLGSIQTKMMWAEKSEKPVDVLRLTREGKWLKKKKAEEE